MSTRRRIMHSDRDLLEMLDMNERQGWSAARIARARGLTRGTVIGLLYRIRKEMQPCRCQKPENKDGALPPRWWDSPAVLNDG